MAFEGSGTGRARGGKMAVLLEACYLQMTLSVLAIRITKAYQCGYCCKWRLLANVSGFCQTGVGAPVNPASLLSLP